RHGINLNERPAYKVDCRTDEVPDLPVRIAFIGRLHPIKGLHILIEAICQLPALPATLDIYGVVQDEKSGQYQRTLVSIAEGDGRIRFHEPLGSTEIGHTL